MGRAHLVMATAGFLACSPELPTRACDSPQTCFKDERCVDGECVAKTRAAPGDAARPGDALESPPDVGASDAAPDAAAGGAGGGGREDASPSDASAAGAG